MRARKLAYLQEVVLSEKQCLMPRVHDILVPVSPAPPFTEHM
jgi:hypothetical protein